MSVARRSLQIVAFICTLVVGVTSMAVIVTQTTWFKEWLRGFIVKQAEDYVNGRLSIGRLDGNLFTGIELGEIDVTMNGKSVVNVGEVGVQYNPLTLIKGDVVLDHIRLDRPHLLLERTANGWNLANLIKARTPDNPNRQRTIEIGEIGISDGSLALHDAVGTSGVDVPEQIDRIDASVAVRSSEDQLKVDIAHVSFRAKDPDLALNALSGTVRRTKAGLEFDNLAVRTEESSVRVAGTINDLDSGNPKVNLTASSDKLAVEEIARIVPALRDYQLQPAFEISAKGPSDRMAVALNVRDANVGHVVGDLTVDAAEPERRVAGTVSLTDFNLAPIVKNEAAKSDITGQARIDMALPSERFPLSGTYAVNAGHVSVAGYEARDVVANGRIDGNTVRVDATAAAYGGTASARGTVTTGERLGIDLAGHAANLDLRNLPPQISAPRVASNLQADYHVIGRGSVYSGDVTLGTSTLAGATLADGTMAHFKVGEGAPSYSATGQISDLDVQQVGTGFDVTALKADRYRSRINGSFDVKGEGGGKYPLALDATGTLTDSEMFGGSFPRLTYTTNLANGDLHVKADGEFAKVDPAIASGNERVKGSLTGELDVDTTIRQYAEPITTASIDASGKVALGTSTIAGVTIDNAMVDGTFNAGAGDIRQLSVTGADLTVTGKGPIVLTDSGNSNLELHIETPSLAKVGELAGQEGLTGGAIIDATVSGNAQTMTVWGNLHGSNLGKGDNNALAVDTTFDVTIPAMDTSVATAHALTTATFVQLGGQKVNGMYVDTTYRDSKLYFSVDAQQEQRQAEVAGEVVFHPDHQEIHLPQMVLRSQQVEWHTAPGTAAAIQYGKDQINVKDVTLVSGDQRITAEGVLGGPDNQPLRIRAENVDVAQLNQIALGQPGEVGGRLAANATLTGPTNAPRVAGDFALTQGSFRMFQFESLGGKVDYDEGGVTLDVRLQQTPTQWLTAKGHAPTTLFRPSTPDDVRASRENPAAGDVVDIQVDSSPIDLGVVQGFTSAVTNVMGTVQANFKLTGSGHDPHLDGAIEVRNGAFEVPDLGTTYTGFDTRINLTPDAVKIADMKVLDNHGSALTIGGQLSVRGWDVGGVQVTMQAKDFKVIDNELGNVRVDTDLHLSGELRAPYIEGSIDVNTGTLDVAKILELVGNQTYSTKATELPTEDPATTAAKVKANAEIPATADSTRPGSAADNAPNTSEAVKRTTDELQAETPGPKPSLFDALSLDITFGVPDDLILKGQGIKAPGGGVGIGDVNLTVGGNIYAQKTQFDTLRLRGDVRTIRGNYTFQGRRFDIQRDGRITFIGTDEIDPLLNVEARRLISGVEAFIKVQGSMRHPELSFRSNPPLEESDVLSLIIFNQPVNELGEGQQASLAQRAGDLAGGYLASGLARSIGSALNLSEFEIKAVDENSSGPSVTLGQQVGKNLFVRVRQAFGDAQATEFILEYQIADFLRLQGTAAETSGGAQRVQFTRVERGGLDLFFFFSY